MNIRLLTGAMLAVGLAVTAGAFVVAESAPGSGAVQPYSADAPLDTGTIVQLSAKSTTHVEIATQVNLANMFGVVIDRSTLPLTITNDSTPNQTYVAVSGTYPVLVSTQNGDIAPGDYVTMSSVNGVAMKAGTDKEAKTVFGRANASFGSKQGVILGTTTLKDSSGGTKTVTLGSVPVTINIQRNPNTKSTKVDVPQFLERLGQQIAEKQINPVRIYLSLAITAVSLIAAIVTIYAGVRNGIISIGRNPMSKKSIFRALFEVILTSILILIIGLFAVYLLLKL